jgi:ABC-type anion transport system duplicated permease subunit
MTFGFYHSLVTIPSDLQEAASVYRMNRWQRFTKLELPSSAIGLMWNSGLRPRVARIAQPLAQIAASFPVNITFPFVVGFFIAAHIPIDFGSVLLMALGTQWYILST